MPRYLDGFVGRDRELAHLRQLLDHGRLLTLTGPGGAGKTRLAAQLLNAAADRLPDRVQWVELAPLSEPTALVPSVASAFGIREQMAERLFSALADGLAAHPTLLVLDNCEHLVDACADLVAELLLCCPELRVLTTSREALRIAGEITFPVGPLSLPGSHEAQLACVERDSEAVRLFVARARECLPGFEVTAAEATIVSEICARLDGIPLAIELAARRVRILPVGEILSRLNDRFELLTVAPRTAPARQRSLRAAVAWSYDLLDPREQTTLQQLALPTGGFDLDGAATLCADGRTRPDEVLGLVSSLEAKSLIVTDTGSTSGRARFRPLETIRLFGLEQLSANSRADQAWAALVAWMTELAQTTIDSVFLDPGTLSRLDDDWQNLHQAFEWAMRAQDPRHVPLGVALACYWRHRGSLSYGRDLLKKITVPDNAAAGERAAYLNQWASAACDRGQYEEALEAARECLVLSRLAQRPELVIRALTGAGLIRLGLRDLAGAQADFLQATAMARPLGRDHVTAGCLQNLAWSVMQSGDLTQASSALEECVGIYRAINDPIMLSAALHTAGALDCERGDVARAEACFTESLRIGDRGDPVAVALGLEGLAVTAAGSSRPERALHLSSAAAALRQAHGVKAEPWWEQRVRQRESAARALIPGADAEAATAFGGNLVGERLRAYLADEPVVQPTGAGEALSPREGEVAALVADGLTNREIARRLHISVRTVDAHLDRIRGKLDVRSRVQIAMWITGRKGTSA